MFTEKEKSINRIGTLIGEECLISGTLKGTGVLKIDGRMDGNIDWSDDVVISITSYCKGNISCKNAFISGSVEGNITCEDILTIEEKGKVKGDLTLKRVIIKDGGILDGKCTMLLEQKTDEVMK
jgi:cytoskeletal protein CcmA (bactofilin family)